MHSNDVNVETKLKRIAEKAKKEPSLKFTSLFHLMNEELLLECFDRLRHNAASGIDHVTKTQYAEHLAENLRQLIEADIKGFFDNVNQDQLMTFLAHRIADTRVLRYIKSFLKAGIQEDGVFRASENGTPQGGVISPLLANLYLHYTLDLWFTRKFAKTCAGTARLIRYADDFVACFQTESDATRYRTEVEARLNQFGLEVAPSIPKMLEFGPFAVKKAKDRGEKAESFDFLGFTHYCSRTRNGSRFRMKRKTISKRFAAKLRVYKEWLKSNRTLTTPEIMLKTAAKLQGHYGYYGVTDNARKIGAYYYEVKRILYKWLNRRGKPGSYNWEKFDRLLERYPLPVPRIKVSLF